MSWRAGRCCMRAGTGCLAPNEFDPEQMVFRDRWVPSYFVILEISGDGENDRMILSCQVSYTVTSSSGDYVPGDA